MLIQLFLHKKIYKKNILKFLKSIGIISTFFLPFFFFFFKSDINECELYPNIQQSCPGCENTIGSYLCREASPPSTPDSEVEAVTTNVVDPYTTEMSAPVKTCGSGMMLDASNNCVDIDECEQGNTGCEICQNTIGSYECKCLPGFELNSDRKTCR